MKKLLFTLLLTMCIALAMHANPVSKSETNATEETAELVVETLIVKSTPNGVIFSVNDDKAYQFGVYSITGQLIKSIKVLPHTSTTITLPKGYYIVRCEKWAKQVVVR